MQRKKFLLLVHFLFSNYSFCSLIKSDIATVSIVTNRSTTLRKGTRGLLPCSVNRAVDIAWWRKGLTAELAKEIIRLDVASGQRSGQGYDDGSFTISDNFSLILMDPRVEDEGRYFCEVFIGELGTGLRNYTDVEIFGKLYFHYAAHTKIIKLCNFNWIC